MTLSLDWVYFIEKCHNYQGGIHFEISNRRKAQRGPEHRRRDWGDRPAGGLLAG